MNILYTHTLSELLWNELQASKCSESSILTCAFIVHYHQTTIKAASDEYPFKLCQVQPIIKSAYPG